MQWVTDRVTLLRGKQDAWHLKYSEQAQNSSLQKCSYIKGSRKKGRDAAGGREATPSHGKATLGRVHVASLLPQRGHLCLQLSLHGTDDFISNCLPSPPPIKGLESPTWKKYHMVEALKSKPWSTQGEKSDFQKHEMSGRGPGSFFEIA